MDTTTGEPAECTIEAESERDALEIAQTEHDLTLVEIVPTFDLNGEGPRSGKQINWSSAPQLPPPPFPTPSFVAGVVFGIYSWVAHTFVSNGLTLFQLSLAMYLLTGIVAGWISDLRNRSPVEGWCLAFFCGPISWAIVAMLPPPRRTRR